MTRATWVKLAFYICMLSIAVGVYLEFGLGWALMLGGLLIAGGVLTLHDIDTEKGR